MLYKIVGRQLSPKAAHIPKEDHEPFSHAGKIAVQLRLRKTGGGTVAFPNLRDR
jgi:hypothetical protein